ncbi:MAG TPA: type IV secretory system conjugative DNA transfer family protein [Xanthobacteraceae bacterium]|nr:type IV secretory system conjugative DNA transfer family protein [Xanthobacteraceae bacterium]
MSRLSSGSPATDALLLLLLLFGLILALIFGLAVLIPIGVAIGVVRGMQWYATRPIPTDRLYAQTEQRSVSAHFPDADIFVDAFLDRLLDSLRTELPTAEILRSMTEIAEELYREERLSNPLPPLPPANTIEEGRYRDLLIAHQRKSVDAPRTLETFHGTLGNAFVDFAAELPSIAKTTRQALTSTDEAERFATFPLVDVLPNPGPAVAALTHPFYSNKVDEIGLFADLRHQLERNLREATRAESRGSSEKLIPADKHKGTAREIVEAYLHHTPFHRLAYAPIPFTITDQQRYEHMHVVGGSGHGKTQLLQRLILHDLNREEPPALVIIDSQGEMLRKIQHLSLFGDGGRLADRIVVIDPEDVDYPPALNMFDMRPARMQHYSQAINEQIEASVIETFNYVFGSLAAELTSRQNTTFAFVTKLMLSVPGATIQTLRELFEDGATNIESSPFAKHIRTLDPTSQAYFANQFFTKSYAQTKHQIARRLYSVLQVPAFERMFASQRNRLDMFDALQAGSVVLVNTSKALLKTEASALFGRYMIARVISAAFERIALPSGKRNPAFLVVDEAAEYFDENLETLLSQARKFNVGVLFAHQHLDQLTPALRAAVAANTSIKLAGGVSDKDARALAPDMRTTSEFVADMKKLQRSTEFACFVRNYTGSAVRLRIPFGALERAPRMTGTEHANMIAKNRDRYTAAKDQSTGGSESNSAVLNASFSPGTGRSADNLSSDAAEKW